MRMETEALLNDLTRRGVLLAAEGDQLRIKAPVGVLTQANKRELASRKSELLAALRAQSDQAKVRLRERIPPADTNRSKPAPQSSTAPGSRMKVYSVTVDGKRITALVPPGKTPEEARQSIINRFGADRVKRVY